MPKPTLTVTSAALLALAAAGCSPAPGPDAPPPAATSRPTATASLADPAPAPTTTPTSSPTADPGNAPEPKSYSGSLTAATVLEGIDTLCKSVETDMEAAKKQPYADAIAVLVAVGPIGIRVHRDLWFAVLARHLGVKVRELETFFDDPKAIGDPDKASAGLQKVEKTFALYKAKRAELEKGLPAATQATCDDAAKKRLDLAGKVPKTGAALDAEVLDVLIPFSVYDQAFKRCEKAGVKM